MKKSDHILISIPPIEGSDIVVKMFSKFIENSNIKYVKLKSGSIQANRISGAIGHEQRHEVKAIKDERIRSQVEA